MPCNRGPSCTCHYQKAAHKERLREIIKALMRETFFKPVPDKRK